MTDAQFGPIPGRGCGVSLEHEMEVYHANVMDLLGSGEVNQGKFTVIKGDAVAGPFDSYQEALDFAYRHHGLSPFLVKKIERNETVHFFSRGL